LEIRQLREDNHRLKMEKDILKKATVSSTGLLCPGNALKYAFINQHKKTGPVAVMSRLLCVSRNTYYRCCQRQRERLPNAEHEAMIEAVKEVAQSSDKSYGSRRIKHALNALGYLHTPGL
jgi:hypothetical protein